VFHPGHRHQPHTSHKQGKRWISKLLFQSETCEHEVWNEPRCNVGHLEKSQGACIWEPVRRMGNQSSSCRHYAPLVISQRFAIALCRVAIRKRCPKL
jgi:hypothetical protein